VGVGGRGVGVGAGVEEGGGWGRVTGDRGGIGYGVERAGEVRGGGGDGEYGGRWHPGVEEEREGGWK